MYSVTIKPLRGSQRRLSRTLQGLLVGPPVVGEPLVVYRVADGTRTITSPIIRTMNSGRDLFVETANSLYRVSFHGRVVFRGEKQECLRMRTREISDVVRSKTKTAAG